jgi:hypothetical protein
MFGMRTAVTKQQKRRDMFISRWNAASTPAEQLRQATNYLRTVCGDKGPEGMARVAWDLFQFAAKADGVEVLLEPEARDAA